MTNFLPCVCSAKAGDDTAAANKSADNAAARFKECRIAFFMSAHSTPNTDAAVRLDGVGLSFGEKVVVLSELDFKIQRGEKVALTGPSGAGKTSLLAVVAGLLRPDTGAVRTCGLPVDEMNEDDLAKMRRDNIGIVFQHFHLLESMTALENVALPLELAGRKDAQSKAQESLAAVGMANRALHFPGQLSGGERQRVAIARAFAPQPQLLLADEPTGNLDSDTGEEILNVLFDLAKGEDKTILFITHNNDILPRFDRVCALRGGRISER